MCDQLVQMSTTHSSFDQYCISHKTSSHRAAAAASLPRSSWSSLWVPHDLISSFAPPRNKSWRRHCISDHTACWHLHCVFACDTHSSQYFPLFHWLHVFNTSVFSRPRARTRAVKRRKWNWLVHTLRTDDTIWQRRVVRQTLQWTVQAQRGRVWSKNTQ